MSFWKSWWGDGYLYWHWSSVAPSQLRRGRATGPADTGSSAFPSLFPKQCTHTHTHTVIYKLNSHIHVATTTASPQTFFLFLLLLPLPPPHPLHSSRGTKVNFQNSLISLKGRWIHEFNSTFAIISAYAIYKGSSSKWLKKKWR